MNTASAQLDMVGLPTRPPDFLPIISLRMVRETSPIYAPEKPVSCARDVFEMFHGLGLADSDREAVWLACLDVRNKITCLHRVSEGTLTASLTHPREIFKTAILSNSASIIMAHNHPSGDPSPSQDDRNITKRIREAGELLGIKLLDHLIIGDNRFYSFQENGD